MVLQNNTVKYDADCKITNTYKNLQIFLSQFVTDKQILVWIQNNLNIYWFIGIRVQLVW